MNDIDIITEMSEEFLMKLLKYKNIEDARSYINSKYIIGYSIFIKQTIFEIFYAHYINGQDEIHSISDIYKRHILQDDNAKSYEYANDKGYVKLRRMYGDFRRYNDELAKKHNKESDIQYIDLKTTNEKMKGHKIKKYQENQLLDIYEFDIFHYIKDGTLTDSSKIDGFRLINALGEFELVYDRIAATFHSYFERSIQYFQLEHNCRIETHYQLAKAVKKVKRTLKEKKEDMRHFKCFVAVTCGGNSLRNYFMLGLEKYIDAYLEKPQIAALIPYEIYEISLIKYQIRTLVVEKLNKIGYRLNYLDNDTFFKDYFGLGQHINKNKKWEEIKLKDFRDLYLT